MLSSQGQTSHFLCFAYSVIVESDFVGLKLGFAIYLLCDWWQSTLLFGLQIPHLQNGGSKASISTGLCDAILWDAVAYRVSP